MKIDGIDISTYTATLLNNSIKSVFRYPKLKEPLKNNWSEWDGLEVDLTAPVLDKKDVVLTFLIEEAQIDNFVNFLKAKTYRLFLIEELSATYKLRCLKILNINKPQGKCTINVKLVSDFPLYGFVYAAPTLTAEDYGYVIDGVNLNKYGLVPLNGTEGSLQSIVKFKDKLEIKSKFLSGVNVAEQASKTREHNATLDLYTKQTVANFIKGYNGFLYALIQSGERSLVLNGITYKFYYNKSEIKDLIVINGIVWCNFIVNIIVL